MQVKIIRLSNEFNDLPLPNYQTEGSAGMDICAALTEPVTIPVGGISLIPTSIAISLPSGYECQVRSRSGLAAKNGIFALNSPGTIDSDYRGEIKIILANFGKENFIVNRGNRIAQLIIAKYERITWQIVNKLDDTERGQGGFGSSGV